MMLYHIPVIVCGCQDDRGRGVSVGCDPRTVHSKQYKKHHQKQNHNGSLEEGRREREREREESRGSKYIRGMET